MSASAAAIATNHQAEGDNTATTLGEDEAEGKSDEVAATTTDAQGAVSLAQLVDNLEFCRAAYDEVSSLPTRFDSRMMSVESDSVSMSQLQAEIERAAFTLMAENKLAEIASLTKQIAKKNVEESDLIYQGLEASGKEQLLEDLQESTNSIFAKYLKEEGNITDYDPKLVEWILNDDLEFSEVSLGIKYAGASLASAVQSKVEAHPIYVAAIQTYASRHRALWQNIQSSLKRAETAELELKELLKGIPAMVLEEEAWTKLVNTLRQEVLAAAKALGISR